MFLQLPKIRAFHFLILLGSFLPALSHAQENQNDSLLQHATLSQVVQYALKHQPNVHQAVIDQEVTDHIIRGKLADWYPQVNFTYNYNHFVDLQSSFIGGNVIKFGVTNTSSAQFNATQNLFNRDVLLASSTATKVRIQAEQNTTRTKMDVVVDVTKAFYDVLATSEQIKVGREDINRLQKSLKDARAQYAAGVADKTDYKRATILLSNAQATLKSNEEYLKFREQNLKAMMGYPVDGPLTIEFDTLQMENEIALDTLQSLNYVNNIDYQILFTQRELQKANVKYNYWAFIPTVSAFGAYNLNFQNNNFEQLYDKRFPYSYYGLTVGIPIFQGWKRIEKIREQKWNLTRVDWEIAKLRSNLSTEYSRALAAYKTNLIVYQTLKENVELAKEVYEVIELQYKNGIRSYLDVTVAETDLRTTRINYYNALYQVLSSKMDVQRVLGQINY